jgi:uncharacterized membrane protein YoaK (UPF0700 family)
MSGSTHGDHETVSRYDLVLGVIPGAYAAGLLAQAVLSVSLLGALVVASLVAMTALVDGLLVHPPV